MGSGKSKWVSNATIGDISGVGEILEDVQGLSEQLNAQIDVLISIAESAIAIVDATSGIVSSVENIEQAVVQGAFDALNSIIETFIEALKEALDFGLYSLPQWEAVDFEKILRTELVSGGRASESIDAEDRFVRVVDKGNPSSFHYERTRRRGRQVEATYEQFIKDIVESFDDRFDVFRPQFDNAQQVSAVIVALAANRVSLFVIAYLLVMCFTKEVTDVKGVANNLRRVLRIALGEAEVLNRNVDDEEKAALQALLELLDEIGSIATLGLSDIIKKLVNFDRGENTFVEGAVEFKSVEVTGNSGNPGVLDTNNLTSNTISFNNTANLSIKSTGNARLDVEVTNDTGITRSFIAGRSQSSWNVTVGVDGIAVSDGSTINTSKDPYAGQYNFSTGVLTNTATGDTVGTPTKVVLTLTEITDTGDIKGGAQTDTYELALTKFNRLDSLNNDLRDGFGSRVVYTLDISESDKRKAAQLLGVSKSEIDRRFPIQAKGSSNIDISRFGEIDTADMVVSVNPSVSLNSDFDGVLAVNGKKYEPYKKDIGVTIAKFYYRDVDISEDDNVTCFTPKVPKFVDRDANFMIYGSPAYGSIKTQGGRLSAPTISSGKSVNASDVILGDAIQINSGKQFLNRYKGLYGTEQGSVSEEKTQYRALYNLRGSKTEGKLVYAVVKVVSGDNKTNSNEKVHLVDFGVGNLYSKNLVLDWLGDSTRYQITVYQIDNTEANRLYISTAKTEKDITHQSGSNSVTVEVTNTGASFKSKPPDWVSVSMGSFLPIAEPLDGILSDFAAAIQESIPSAPYGLVQDWLDAMEAKLQDLIDLLERLQGVIDNINGILQIGGTGFYFLGIDKANGIEGFKQRLKKVEAPRELTEARIVTGLVMLTPADLFGVPTGSLMMDTVFSRLPSEGTDSVKVPERQPLSAQLIGTYENSKLAVESELESIKTASTKIKDISRGSMVEINKKSRDIE